MRAALALLLGTLAGAVPNHSARRLQSDTCADLTGDGAVNVEGARANRLALLQPPCRSRPY